jgi:hypothetical protein
MDVFSAGCVLYYLEHGTHPFGQHFEREKNIRSSKLRAQLQPTLVDALVGDMIVANPADRLATGGLLLLSSEKVPINPCCGFSGLRSKKLYFIRYFGARLRNLTFLWTSATVLKR